MDEVGDDVVEQTLVVRDDHEGVVGLMQLVDAMGHDAQGVDVEARVGLVEDGEAGFQHGHLEDLVFLLLATAVAHVDEAVLQLLGDFDHGLLLLHHLHEVDGAHRRQTLVLTFRVDGGAHEVLNAHARDFDRILEAEEDAFVSAVLRRHPDDVLALVPDLTFGDFIALATRDGRRKGALSCSVGSHDGVDFAFVDA